MYVGLHVTCPLFFSDSIKLKFSRQIFDKSTVSNLIKIRPMVAELLHADGRTDGRTEGQADVRDLMVAFRNFADASKKRLL